MDEDEKRVFFGLEVQAPWPEHFPKGRLLEAKDRHATFAFLGSIPHKPLLQSLKDNFPIPPFKVGLVGHFSNCLFLPPNHPNVVAWNVLWDEDAQKLSDYRPLFLTWLKENGYSPKEHGESWLCHVTLSRKPFDFPGWRHTFKLLPMAIFALHLYESLGHSRYRPIWSYPFIPPFDEIEHTADIAYLVNGENLLQLHRHAQSALAFRYPALIPYMNQFPLNTFEDMVMALNETIAKADSEIGCPFKAISFHGGVEEKNTFLQWEMIVDV